MPVTHFGGPLTIRKNDRVTFILGGNMPACSSELARRGGVNTTRDAMKVDCRRCSALIAKSEEYKCRECGGLLTEAASDGLLYCTTCSAEDG